MKNPSITCVFECKTIKIFACGAPKKHLKALFLRWKSYFRSLKSQNFRACGATTLPTIIQNVGDVVQSNYYKIIVQKTIIIILFIKRLLSKQFSNLQAAIALSTHAQNVFYKLVGALRLGYIIFTGGYRALYTCTKRVYKVWLGRGRNVIIFDSRAATALSTHAQNACKKKYFVRKMRRRRENFEIQELKRSFLVLKTRKIYQNRVKNSSKIAPKARKFLGTKNCTLSPNP